MRSCPQPAQVTDHRAIHQLVARSQFDDDVPQLGGFTALLCQLLELNGRFCWRDGVFIHFKQR